jgi:fluoride exporter
VLENLLYLSAGAVLGALARFAFTHWSSELSQHHGFPIGTLLVNVIGSFIVGYVLTWFTDPSHDRWRIFAATGFCGAFTTFSAFAYETLAYWHAGQKLAFVANILLNNVLSFGAVIAGIALRNGRAG